MQGSSPRASPPAAQEQDPPAAYTHRAHDHCSSATHTGDPSAQPLWGGQNRLSVALPSVLQSPCCRQGHGRYMEEHPGQSRGAVRDVLQETFQQVGHCHCRNSKHDRAHGSRAEPCLERQDGGTWTAPVTTSTFSVQRGSAGSPSASSLTSSNDFWIRNF